MKRNSHAIAGVVGFLTILLFWSSTVVSELFTSHETIALVKTMILRGMFILIPAMIIVGTSGMNMGWKRKDAQARAKKRRMPFIAVNDLVILLPAAFYLQFKAANGVFDSTFYAIQVLELIAGATNLILMGLNIRDGRAMARRKVQAQS